MAKWFKWEREASIHLLMPALEGSMGLLKKVAGLSLPTTILIFRNGVVSWCYEEDIVIPFCLKYAERYLDPINEQKMWRVSKKTLKNLQQVENKISKINLAKLANQELINLQKVLLEAFLAYYSANGMDEVVGWGAEAQLKSLNFSDEQISFLATPKKPSFAQEAESYLLQTRDPEKFVKKYFWIENNYGYIKELSLDEAKGKLVELLRKRQSKIEQKIKVPPLNKKTKRLIELLKNFTYYQDERKRNILIYFHYLNLLLKEATNRSKLSLDDFYNILPWEFKDVLEGRLDSHTIQKRKEYCVVVWEDGKMSPQVYTGAKAQKVEEQMEEEDLSEMKIIKGNIASVGLALGKVRVLKTAKDCHLLKRGEILVTFMTSPDFMPAIRKCAAIVTDLGGITSHAAIISRELKIPCIVGTNIATKVLKTGDRVEVDANKGVVTIEQ